MSTFWPGGASPVVIDQPRLHALVIGVARYPHLQGGSGPEAQDTLMLRQITTPAFTARAIADWLASNYRNTECPLGSIELLASDAPPMAPGNTTATMRDVEDGVTRWFQRCSSNPDNIALFYFCGHGLAKDNQYLLPEDFGDPQYPDPWRNCIDFDALRLGLMTRCPCATQVFFVDACREIPFSALTQVNVGGRNLLGGPPIVGKRSQAVYYATSEREQAYGPANDVSYFGQAVLRCFNGLAGTNTQGAWVVDTYSMSAALGRVMDHLATKYGKPLSSSCNVSGKAALLHEPAQASVLASIECSSREATAAAEIVLQRSGVSYRAGVADQKPLLKEVSPGDWEVMITFPGGTFPASSALEFTLMPPIFEGVAYP